MNEIKFRKRILRFTSAVVASCLLLAVCAIVILFSIRRADQKSYDTYVNNMINGYKLRFQSLVEADLDALRMVAELLAGEMPARADARVDFTYLFSSATRFEDIIFYGLPELQEAEKAGWEAQGFSEEVSQTLTAAMEGQGSVSRVPHNKEYQTLTYAVPVYQEEKLVGVLAASKNAESFFRILKEKTLTDLQFDILWLEQTGEILTSGKQDGIGEGTIFELWTFTDAEKKQIEAHMAENERYIAFVKTGREASRLYLTPIELHGWYMAYLDDGQTGLHSPVYSTILIVEAAFWIVVFLGSIFSFYAYRFVREDNRNLIDLAGYDQLTGTFNLTRFLQEVKELGEKRAKVSVLAFDLRSFGYINEVFGQKQADKLLCAVADILKKRLKKGEVCCRSSADRFYAVFFDLDKETVQERIQNIVRMVELLSQYFHKNFPVLLYCGVSLGETISDNEMQDNLLLRKAEFALESIRKRREEYFAVYDEAMHEKEKFNHYIEGTMRKALGNREFQVYLQAKKNLKTDEIAGAEALVRWRRPDGSTIFPDRFIPLFEQNGFCAELDLYMVEQVCRLEQSWMERHMKMIPVSVNQSKILFYQEDYVEKLCEITDKYKVPRNMIILEILEGLAAENLSGLNDTIMRLKKEGFQISLDDFGSGYSTLNVLSGIDVDEIKLDRNFLLQGQSGQVKKQSIVMKNVVRMLRDFRVRTVVEGVESRENEDFIRAIGCDYGQGYFYSKPIPVTEFEARFMKGRPCEI